MNWITALAGLAVSALCALAAFTSVFAVRPESQAVISRGGQVDRVLGPGLQAHWPILEQVTIYEVTTERQVVLDGPFEVADCPAEVALV